MYKGERAEDREGAVFSGKRVQVRSIKWRGNRQHDNKESVQWRGCKTGQGEISV